MDELIQRLRSLPKQPMTCQGGIFLWPRQVREPGESPFRPCVLLWAEAESGMVHTDGLLNRDEDPQRALLDGLGSVVEMLGNQACPDCLEVRDPELAEYLRDQLAGSGIEICLTDRD